MTDDPAKRIVWICIWGGECSCAGDHGAVDQCCINSRRVEVETDADEDED